MGAGDGSAGGTVPGQAEARLHLVGLAAAAGGTALMSLNGVIVREMEAASGFQLVFYRSVSLLGGLSVLYLLRHRGHWRQRLREALPLALRTGPFHGLSSIAFIMALGMTTVAATLFLQGAVPLLAAALAWAMLGERPGRAALAAMAGVLAGVALMVGDGIAGGTLLGNLLALLAAGSYAIYIVLLRRGRAMDMLPAVMVGGVTAAAISAVLAPSLAIGTRDLVACLLWGAFLQCAAASLFTYGARFLPAAELTLIAMVEVVLGPLWPWLLLGEEPSVLSLAGGALILAAVAGWTIVRARER